MNESWFWIKQRPHFIAENLGKYYKMDVFCEKRYKNRVASDVPANLNVHEIYKFPLTQNIFIKRINKMLHKYFLFKKYFSNIEEKYDIIWFSSPKHFDYIKRFISDEKIVVYDCMDDLLEFEGSKKNEKILNEHFSQEKNLFERSNFVFCSSETLKNKLIGRFGKKDNIFVVNNAIFIEDTKENIPEEFENVFKLNKKTLCYFGTISEWFDFDILIKCLDEFKEIGIILVGPTDVNIPTHERLYKFPPVSHKSLMALMKKSDALIMPFKITELVKGVNPVKIYEYIYSCVPSIVVSYPETEKFGDFVFLYNNYNEFRMYIQNLCRNNLKLKKPAEKYEEFAMQNTWENRIDDIIKILKH